MAVGANLPACKGLIHIDLQMNPDQRRLDKACSPNCHHASCIACCSEAVKMNMNHVSLHELQQQEHLPLNIEIKKHHCYKMTKVKGQGH